MVIGIGGGGGNTITVCSQMQGKRGEGAGSDSVTGARGWQKTKRKLWTVRRSAASGCTFQVSTSLGADTDWKEQKGGSGVQTVGVAFLFQMRLGQVLITIW